MSTFYNPKVVTEGLVLYYDMANKKSWKGAPTTNIIAGDFDTTFDTLPISSTAGFSNQLGTGNYLGVSNIISYSGAQSLRVNNGVGGTGRIYRTVPLGLGDFCIASAMVYSRVAGPRLHMEYYGGNYSWGVTGGVVFNTHTGNGWEFLYIKANLATTSITTCYYFYYPTIDNVDTFVDSIQVEKGTIPSSYINGTRTATQAVLDIKNSTILTASSLTYNSDNTFNFNGTSDRIVCATPNLPAGTGSKTILCFTWPDSTGPSSQYTGLVAYGGRGSTTPSDSVALSLYTSGTTMHVSSAFWNNDYVPNNLPVIANAWNFVGIVARGAGSTNNVTLISGNSNGLNFITGNSSNYTRGLNTTSVNLSIGCLDGVAGGRYMKGKIPVVLIYSRELSMDEIRSVFNAMRGRYGI